MGPSIKDVRSQRGLGVLSSADVHSFWRKNHRNFRNLWCVRTDKGVGSRGLGAVAPRFSNM